MIDLSRGTGLPVALESDSGRLRIDDPYALSPSTRTEEEMRPVLMAPEKASFRALYTTYVVRLTDDEQELLDSYDLIYGLVVIRPGPIGREFPKTFGHYHTAMPGSSKAYPEIYGVVHGRMLSLIQRVAPGDPSRVEQVYVVHAEAGQAFTIPHGYGHLSINPGSEPVVFAGLWSRHAGHDYDGIARMRGAAYYAVEQDGGVELIRNSNYTAAPSPVEIDLGASDIPSELWVPQGSHSLLSAFVNDPEAFRYLVDSRAPMPSEVA